MPLYAFIGFDHPPHSMPLRDKLRVDHRNYVQSKECHVVEWRMALNSLEPTSGWVKNYETAKP
jgi:hypothetical protein